jgi:hypothetical protein
MKKIILTFALGLTLISSTVPQFFYYNNMRKAIAIRDTEKGEVIVRNNTGQALIRVDYPADQSRWISVTRLAPGFYTATTTDGSTISFYKRP